MNFLSLVSVAARRLWSHRLLMGCLWVGLVTAVGLLSSNPLYADAIHNRLLQGELTEAGTHRPPFAFMWRYVGAWHGEIDLDRYRPLNEYLVEQAPDVLGLPLAEQVRYASTGNMRLFPAPDSPAFAAREPLFWTGAGFISGLEERIDLLEGRFPQAGDGSLEVILSQTLAEQAGLQVGEAYLLVGGGAEVPVHIAGVWRPLNSADPFWFYQPHAFDELLLTTETAFMEQLGPRLARPVDTAVWYQIYDGERVRTADVPGLLERVATVEVRVTALLDNTTLDASPVPALQTYGRAARLLTLALTVFSLPILGLVLYFMVQIAGMVVQRSQGEIAVLRSRGMTRGQVLLLYLLEGALLGAAGLAGGLLLGRRLAALMGRTRTFLDPAFAGNGQTEPLLIVLSPTAWRYGLLGVGLAILALALPALAASRHTIISFKSERARTLLRPLWQRYFLDLLLLILALYGWYQLRRQGTIALLGGGQDPFTNPLLFLVPVLFCFSLALVAVRLFPFLMSGLAWLARWLPGPTPLLILRQLARSSGRYVGPLLLLSLTVSLAAFTASMALTLDNHLHDEVYYQIGADLNLAELGESVGEADQPGLGGAPPGPDAAGEGPRWLFLPVSEHLDVPGVREAARVGEFNAATNIGGRQQSGRLLGVDRLAFSRVAFFRPDFAAESLGGLMNRLAVDQANLLVSADFLSRNALQVGDPLRLTVDAEGEFSQVEFTVGGVVDLFPGHYPEDEPLFVGNLEYIFESLGGMFPYNVWLAVDPGVPGEQIVSGVRERGLTVVTAADARQRILQQQGRPQRQGLFGLLSVGFLAAAALTVLGFLVYAVVSFQRRFIELGMLRAVGLSVWQMRAYLAGEQAILILTGLALGTALGAWASRIFIPFFQVGEGRAAFIPPFIVYIAWEQIGVIAATFGAMFLMAVIALIFLLRRMRLFEAVKLGESVFFCVYLCPILLLVACGQGAGAQATTPTPLPTPVAVEKPTYTVQRGTVVRSLEVTGRVAPAAEQRLFFRSDGFVRQVFVARDEMVEEGQVLAELEIDRLEEEMAQALLAQETAETNLALARQNHEDAMAEAQIRLEMARLQLQRAQSQPVSAAATSAQIAVTRAEEALAFAQEEYAKALDRPWEPEDVVQGYARAVTQAERNLTIARARYNEAVAAQGSQRFDLQILEQEVALAELRLAELERGVDPLLALEVERAGLAVERLQRQIDDARLTAPFAGQILSINLQPGANAEAFQPVIVLADPSALEVTVEPGAADLAELSADMSVVVQLRNRPGAAPLDGFIRQLPHSGDAGAVQQADRLIRISLEDEGVPLELGELATVTVVLEEREDVLWLPPAAIRAFQGRDFVVVQDGDIQRRVDVRLGIQSADRLEILEGVDEGQLVIGP